MATKTDIYQSVTNSIVEAIENGATGEQFVLPWHGVSALPQNACTGKPYHGVNVPMLWACQMSRGFPSGIWATYKQWQEKGAQVKKGEKGSQVVFWKRIDIEPTQDDEERQGRMFARWSTVFNAQQVDGFELTPDYEPAEFDALAAADALVKASGADIRHGEARAYYRPSEDYINLPSPEAFKATSGSSATQNFYSVLFYELTHWSGSAHRLDRKKHKKFGDADYAFEELIAELGAAMVCVTTGVETAVREDHAHYIANWLKALKGDKQFIFAAASQAQKAVDYLHSLQA